MTSALKGKGVNSSIQNRHLTLAFLYAEGENITHLTTVDSLEAGIVELIERLRLEERAGVRLLHAVEVAVRQRRVGQPDTRARR